MYFFGIQFGIQLDTTPEKCIHDRVNEHFLDKEIENAKYILFDICGGIDTAKGERLQRYCRSTENPMGRRYRTLVHYNQEWNHAMPDYITFIG